MADTLDRALQSAMNEVPECVAAGCVDTATGLLVSVKTMDSHPGEVLNMVSAATTDLFQGANAAAIEDMFKRARGAGDEQHRIQEIVTFSGNLLHIFLRCKKNIDHVLVFVCRKSANLGMVIAKSRIALPAIDASL